MTTTPIDPIRARLADALRNRMQDCPDCGISRCCSNCLDDLQILHDHDADPQPAQHSGTRGVTEQALLQEIREYLDDPALCVCIYNKPCKACELLKKIEATLAPSVQPSVREEPVAWRIDVRSVVVEDVPEACTVRLSIGVQSFHVGADYWDTLEEGEWLAKQLDHALRNAKAPQTTIKAMVNRFLGWPLPRDFCPDCGISFDGRKPDAKGYAASWPVGTNLFTAEQAEAMFEHAIAATLAPSVQPTVREGEQCAYGKYPGFSEICTKVATINRRGYPLCAACADRQLGAEIKADMEAEAFYDRQREQQRAELAAQHPAVGDEQIDADRRDGIGLIAAERKRQIEAEGWTPEHDDKHRDGSLVAAAVCYALADDPHPNSDVPDMWPFDIDWWKPRDDLSNLVRSAALIVAEIDRLQRAAIAASPSDKGG